MQAQSAIGSATILHADFATALARVIDALKMQGFGVLTEIDVKETFKKKLDVAFRPYRILGACNPQLAYRALSSSSEVGLFLPCNVTVAQVSDTETEVAIVNPMMMVQMVPGEALAQVAVDAQRLLDAVMASLQE